MSERHSFEMNLRVMIEIEGQTELVLYSAYRGAKIGARTLLQSYNFKKVWRHAASILFIYFTLIEQTYG